MKYAKLLSLIAAALAVLMGLASGASATVVTSNGSVYTGKIHSVSENGQMSLHGSNGVTIQCAWTTEGQVESHGASVTASVSVISTILTGCSGLSSLHVLNRGSLILHPLGSGDATFTSTGTKVEFTASTVFGTIPCTYTTNETDLGTLTGSSTTGGNATIDYGGTIPRTGGSAICGPTGVLTGSAKVTAPANLNMD